MSVRARESNRDLVNGVEIRAKYARNFVQNSENTNPNLKIFKTLENTEISVGAR